MKSIVEKYDACLPHKRDYLSLLGDTNLMGKGKNLKYDSNACGRLGAAQ